jgi:4'-phosphopantetheinyl transferase
MTTLHCDIDCESPLAPQAAPDGSLWWQAGALRLCFVGLADLLPRHLPQIDRRDFRRQPPIALDAAHPLGDILNPGEIDQVNRYKALKRQVEWIAGRLAVKKLVARWLRPDLPPSRIQVAHHPQGAPFLPCAPDTALSISHAGDYAVAGLELDRQRGLGLDIEAVKPRAVRAVLTTAFSATERRALPAAATPDAVFRRWCLKEAFLKYIGRGFHENLTRVEILDGAVRHHGQTVSDLTLQVARPFPRHILAVISGPRRSVDQSPASRV